MSAEGRAIGREFRSAILDYLRTHKPRRFEPGTSGDTTVLLDWLGRHGREARRGTTAHCKNGRIYLVDGKRHTLHELIALVDALRQKQGLEPISLLHVQRRKPSRPPRNFV